MFVKSAEVLKKRIIGASVWYGQRYGVVFISGFPGWGEGKGEVRMRI